jgi:hypothetical protein
MLHPYPLQNPDRGPPLAPQFRSGYSTNATFQARGRGCTAIAVID